MKKDEFLKMVDTLRAGVNDDSLSPENFMERIHGLYGGLPREWSLKIQKVSNGFLLTGIGGDSEDEVIEMKEDKQGADDSKVEATALETLVYRISDFFGMNFGKHSEYTFRFSIRKQ